MAFELARLLAATERSDDLHIARLLLLAAARDGGADRSVEGLTKLAKLDFLLRYPANLERALAAIRRNPDEAHVAEYERTNIESEMIRFRYGPWDHRYRRWLSLMLARGLIRVGVQGNTVHIWTTELGRETARLLSEQDGFKDVSLRASVIAKRFGGRNGTALKNFIYDTFPEITTMKWGQAISP